MNMELIPMAERAAQALSKSDTEAEIKALVEQSKPIVAVADSESRRVCHDSLMTLKTLRVRIEKRGKEGREEATRYSKAVITIEKELIALLTPEETRLAKLRDDYDAAKEAEREAKVQAELRRVADLQERLVELRGNPMLTPTSGSKLIAEHIGDLDDIAVDASFEELEPQAHEAKAAGLARLWSLHLAAVAHEAEQERLKAEWEELALLRAEQAERDRIARESQAKADAEAKAERDRLAAEIEAHRQRQAAEARAHAQALAEERAENERIARESREAIDRQEREAKERQATEAARLAAERPEFERQQEAARRAAEPVRPKPRVPAPPPFDQIVAVVAAHWKVEAAVAIYWLGTCKATAA